MIVKKHKYCGVWYKVGAKFKNSKHEEWACDAVRKYGKKQSTTTKKIDTK